MPRIPPGLITPWNTTSLWQEAVSSVAWLADRCELRLAPARRLADRITDRYAELDVLFGRLCNRTCPDCTDTCCHRATVWYDFKDLVYLTLCGMPVPEAQIHRHPDGHCACLGREGCIHPRSLRPFICTWYLCPAQKALLEIHDIARIETTLHSIKTNRRRLEDLFVRVTGDGP